MQATTTQNSEPDDLFGAVPPTLHEMQASVQREIALRKRTYPRWVGFGKMSATTAAYEIRCMEEVASLLAIVAGKPR